MILTAGINCKNCIGILIEVFIINALKYFKVSDFKVFYQSILLNFWKGY